MSFNPIGRAFVDPSRPTAFSVCDRCGFWWNRTEMQFQRTWAGPTIITTGVLVCPPCLDDLQPQLKTIILPPDPEPVMNARVEPFSVDEAGTTQSLACQIVTSEASIGASFFVDLYDGDPDAGGESVLFTLTGSATRTNRASIMTTVGNRASNNTAITITTSADATAEVAWIVIFNAATGSAHHDAKNLIGIAGTGQLGLVAQRVELYAGFGAQLTGKGHGGHGVFSVV